MYSEEGLFSIDLSTSLKAPLFSATGEAMVFRRAVQDDLAQSVELAVSFGLESFGEHHVSSREYLSQTMQRYISTEVLWVADAKGKLVGTAALNSRARDVVQLGQVYTSPDWRGKGVAKRLCWHLLENCRTEGSSRAVLFTDSAPATSVYTSLGFERVGDYTIALFQS